LGVLIIRQPASHVQLEEMSRMHGNLIKVAVDIEREILAGGGEMHADCEEVLLDDGSHQRDIWGGDWLTDSQTVKYGSFINIRPGHGNRSLEVQDKGIRTKMEYIVRRLLESD